MFLGHAPFAQGHGGVRQYIHKVFPSQQSRKSEMVAVLQKLLPEDPSIKYQPHFPIPTCFPGYLVLIMFHYVAIKVRYNPQSNISLVAFLKG